MTQNIFSSLVEGIVIEDQLLLKYTIFKSETKKNRKLLSVEFLVVIWVQCILRYLETIQLGINYLYSMRIGHCWRSKDELISDILLWTCTYDRAKAGRPARTYFQQLCEDMGCSHEDLPEAMNDREKWRERVWDIRAIGTWWWWWDENIWLRSYNCVREKTLKNYAKKYKYESTIDAIT